MQLYSIIELFSCKLYFCVIPSPWSVCNSGLICFFLQVLFVTKFNDSISDSSSSAYLSILSNLSKGSELDLEGTTGDGTGMDLVTSLLVSNSFKRTSLGLYWHLSLTSVLSLTFVLSPTYPLAYFPKHMSTNFLSAYLVSHKLLVSLIPINY